MTAKFEELVEKLKEIFQIDKPELDFGVYRILHARSKEINEFLTKRLAEKVQAALAGNAAAEQTALKVELEKTISDLKAMGVADTDAIPKVAELKAKLAATGGGSDQAESEVYSHLLTFFSRYYDDGDFISKRRYKGDTYAIPYAGEEVKLHWANADQYYVKSGENFTNYDFTIDGGAKVHFKLVTAETAKDNIKDNEADRRFVLFDPESVECEGDSLVEDEEREPLPTEIVEEKDGELYIYFQYLKVKKGTKQKDLIAKAEEKVMALVPKFQKFIALAGTAPTEKDKNRTLFRKHLEQYTAKNTSDYFIHKDLKGFLTRELDFYIKNEMMHLDDIQNATAFKQIEMNLREIQAVRTIAAELIDFMAQIEDFQKKLWLKKKFVTRCDYCITMDRVPEALHAEVFANVDQQKEWEKLGLPVGPALRTDRKAQGELFGDSAAPAVDGRMVDTKFFGEEFKAKLLASISDFDGQCDGVLVHSDNFQGVEFLYSRCAGEIKCVYLDPPYNTSDVGFIYKNNYRHSSWVQMVTDRFRVAYKMLTKNGALMATIDDEELFNLKLGLDTVLGRDNFIGNIVIESNPRGRGINSYYATCHEYCLAYAKVPSDVTIIDQELTADQIKDYKGNDGGKVFRPLPFRRSGGWSTPNDRPNSEFPLYFNDQGILFAVGGERSMPVPHEYSPIDILVLSKDGKSVEHLEVDDFKVRYPDAVEIMPVDGNGMRRVWRWSDRLKILQAGKNGEFILKDEGGRKYVQLKDWIKEGRKPKTIWSNPRYDSSTHGTNLLKDIIGEREVFGFPKSVHSTFDSLHTIIGGENCGNVLDLFGGSGTTAHAVIALNREDGGHRKYILVEMGDHFDTVLKPRIEKVVYSPDWKDGKPVSSDKGISHCFKYLTLESYEDALNNIELEDKSGLFAGVLKDEYLLKYMLDLESRGSVINTDNFRKPFDYELKIAVDSSGASEKRKIDLVETFNYLIGMTVLSTDRHIDKGYVLVTGKLPGEGKESLVVWRDCEKVDNEALNKLLATKGVKPGDSEFKTIFINGDHAVPNTKLGADEGEGELKIRQIENIFLEKMFEEK